MPHILGISLGFAGMMLALALALGVGGVFRAAPWLYGVLRWLGAAYLLWLAWRIATARRMLQSEAALVWFNRVLAVLL